MKRTNPQRPHVVPTASSIPVGRTWPWVLVSFMVGWTACSSGPGGENGSGGQSGSGTGGVHASGGATSVGTGGASATGGSRTGGTSGSGGSVGAGGSGTGGSMASGGAAAGGAGGAGGSQGSGGAPGGGGRAGADAGSGGTVSSGGTTGATGGTTSSGGATGTGGSKADAGAPDATPDMGTVADAGSTFSPCPTTAGTACAILPLGDSITEGCCTAPMGGYRIELFHQALSKGKNITFVGSATNGPSTVDGKTFPQHHEGHGGYTIDTGTGHSGISGQITDNALSSYKPHIVLLMIGTNDINGNVDTANAPTRLAALIDDITTRAPSALLVVSSIIPSKSDGTNTNFQKYNAAIPGLVETRAKAGKHIVFLDNYKVFSQNASYKTAWMADNLHPNTNGYVALGQSFYGVIADLLPAAP